MYTNAMSSAKKGRHEDASCLHVSRFMNDFFNRVAECQRHSFSNDRSGEMPVSEKTKGF